MTVQRPGRLRRGNWQPGQTNGALLAVQLVVVPLCAVRGLDYMRDDPAQIMSRIQDTAPLPVWVAGFVVATVTGMVALLGRWGPMLAAAHCIAMAMYLMVAYRLLLVTGVGPGVRYTAELLGFGLVHGALGVGIFTILRRKEIDEELAGGAP